MALNTIAHQFLTVHCVVWMYELQPLISAQWEADSLQLLWIWINHLCIGVRNHGSDD